MKIRSFATLIIGIFLASNNVQANPDPPIKEGKAIFTTRCASCHNVNKIMTGPALAGIDERRSMDWIVKFIHSSQTMVKGGDKDAIAVYEKFNKIPMPDHGDLSEENIKNIVEFIKSEAKAVGNEKAPFAKPGSKKAGYLPISLTKNFWPLMGLSASIILLIAALLFAARVGNLKSRLEESK